MPLPIHLNPWPAAFSRCNLAKGFLFLEPPCTDHLFYAARVYGRTAFLNAEGCPIASSPFTEDAIAAFNQEHHDNVEAGKAFRAFTRSGRSL